MGARKKAGSHENPLPESVQKQDCPERCMDTSFEPCPAQIGVNRPTGNPQAGADGGRLQFFGRQTQDLTFPRTE